MEISIPGGGVQGLLTCWDHDRQAGYGMFLGDGGALEFWVGDGNTVERLSTECALLADRWYRLSCGYDSNAGTVTLSQQPLRRFPADPSQAVVTRTVTVVPATRPETAFVMAGVAERTDGGARFCFNGKLEAPVVLRSSSDGASAGLAGDVVAAWDLGSDHAGTVVTDGGPERQHGRAVNAPLRAVTGSNWTGREPNFNYAPEQYRAIHFHDDDLDDAGWSADFELTVPKGLQSGFYAMHLQTGDAEDWVPFLVAPPQGVADSEIALLAPTLSYVAYANEHMVEDEVRSARAGVPYTEYL